MRKILNNFRIIIIFIKKYLSKKSNIKKAKIINKKKNIKNLNAEQIEEIDRFWRDITSIDNYEWHKVYSEIDKFDTRYIPEYIFQQNIIPKLNKIEYRDSYADKNIFDYLYPKIKKPKTIVRNINGKFYDEKYCEILNLEEFFENIREEKYIVKPTLEYGGKGIGILERRDHLFYLNKKEISVSEFLKSYEKNFIVQEIIKQDKKISKIYPDSLNTIRIMSLRLENKVRIISSVIRFGNNGSFTDNVSSGGFSVGINNETGVLRDNGYDIYGRTINGSHPYTKEKFKNFKIENYEKIKKIIKEWHGMVPPYFDLVSWDIGIDENEEPIFVEMNIGIQGINLHQFSNGPLFGDKTEEYLKKIMGRVKNVSF